MGPPSTVLYIQCLTWNDLEILPYSAKIQRETKEARVECRRIELHKYPLLHVALPKPRDHRRTSEASTSHPAMQCSGPAIRIRGACVVDGYQSSLPLCTHSIAGATAPATA